MTIDDKIREGKLQYNINREAAKISALLPEKLIDKNILQVKKHYLLIESNTFSFRKNFGKTNKNN